MRVERKYFHDLFGGEAAPGSISKYVILVQDPLSVEPLSGNLEEPKSVADHYEFRVITGSWMGIPLTLCSTGIGGGSTSIAVDNLVNLGAKTFLYMDIGLSGLSQPGAWAATGAIRQDGASLDYARPEFPAAADPEVLMAILASGRDLKVPVVPALMWASVGALRPGNEDPYQAYNANLQKARRSFVAPIVPVNPEVATLLTLGTLYRLRAGAIFAGVTAPEEVQDALKQYFRLVLLAFKYLHAWDTEKARSGWKIMTPKIQVK
jgi:uridine phosphorylase